MPPIAAGRLRSRVAVQVNTPALPYPVGQQPTWNTVATVWAEIIQSSGDQIANSDQTKAVATHRITLRQNPKYTIEPGQNRIVYKGQIYNVVSVSAVDNLNVYYEIMAKQIIGPQGQA